MNDLNCFASTHTFSSLHKVCAHRWPQHVILVVMTFSDNILLNVTAPNKRMNVLIMPNINITCSIFLMVLCSCWEFLFLALQLTTFLPLQHPVHISYLTPKLICSGVIQITHTTTQIFHTELLGSINFKYLLRFILAYSTKYAGVLSPKSVTCTNLTLQTSLNIILSPWPLAKLAYYN